MRYDNFTVTLNDRETRLQREPILRETFTDFSEARERYLALVAGAYKDEGITVGDGGAVYLAALDGQWRQTIAEAQLGLLNADWLVTS